MKTVIPARDRSKVVSELLEREITAREQRLFQCAKELEESAALRSEMTVWDSEFAQDGLDDAHNE